MENRGRRRHTPRISASTKMLALNCRLFGVHSKGFACEATPTTIGLIGPFFNDVFLEGLFLHPKNWSYQGPIARVQCYFLSDQKSNGHSATAAGCFPIKV